MSDVLAQLAQGKLNLREISRKGRQLFEALPEELKQSHRGKFVAIEAESGDCFLGKTPMEADEQARSRHPGKIFFLGRLGYRTAFTFKGRR